MPRRELEEFVRTWNPRWRPWLAAGLLGLVAYGCFCGYHARIVPGGSDSSGYFNLAQALIGGRIDLPARPIEGLPPAEAPALAYTPLGFRPSADPESITPTYPVGLPSLLALGAGILGWTAGPALIFALLAIAGPVLTYGLARQVGLSPPAAALGGIALALCPLYLRHCLFAMSDLPALVAASAALGLGLRSSLRSTVIAGAAAGIAVLIRPSNILVLGPLLLALGPDRRRLLGAAAGGLPFAALFALFNRAAYGSVWSTGYGDVSSAFSPDVALVTLLHYATWLPLLLSPLVALAAAAPLVRPARLRELAVHASWFVVLGAFYAFYFHTHETWWYLRFLLPAFPSVIVLALLGGEGLLSRLERPRPRRLLRATAAVAVLASCLLSLRMLDVVRGAREEDTYPRGVALVRAEVPARGVILAMQHSGSLYFGTGHVIVRWDMLEGQWPRFLAAASRAGRPVYALLFDFEREPALRDRVPGKWRPVRSGPDLHLLALEPTAAP